jgi:iron complex transport system ATP-binding protein
MVCFMGRNGIGKSTLIRTLAGLQAPIHGRIILPTETSLPPGVGGDGGPSTNIAVVLTEKISAVSMTVHELVTYGRYPYLNWTVRLSPADSAIVNDAIDRVGIQSIARKKLHQLSDGQLQMVMIARALAQTTPLILLDEPTAHLDLNNRIEIMRLLRTLAREQNKAILVATHELDLALQTADRVWLAGNNQDVITGIPEDLVLDGTFDTIFQFKGFNLKTGAVHHTTIPGKTISLDGTGTDYQWTKNALERNGFLITPSAPQKIVIINKGNTPAWTLNGQEFTKLEDLFKSL